MKTRTSGFSRLRRKKKIDYSNYHFVLALYTIHKKEGKKEARLPVHDFRKNVFQKQSNTASLKQRVGRYIMAIRKAIAVIFSSEKTAELLINRLSDTSARHHLR